VKRKNTKTGREEEAEVGQLQLGDPRGVITCSFWRTVAENNWNKFKNILDESIELDKVAFYRLTHLSVMETKATPLTHMKKLNTTENTTVEFLDFRATTIQMHDSLCVRDYSLLQRPLPYTCSLQGIVIEPFSRRQAASGVSMCSFALANNGVSVPCVAYGTNADLDLLHVNAQIAIFGALCQDDRQRPGTGRGTLWIHDDAFVMKTGEVLKPPKSTRSLTLP
jgi:hypothetical protein